MLKAIRKGFNPLKIKNWHKLTKKQKLKKMEKYLK
jgi:hypothetical protein